MAAQVDINQALAALKEHPEVMETLDRQIREHYHFGTEGAETDAEEK